MILSDEDIAKEVEADLIGGEELVEEIKNGKIVAGVDFNVVVATPEMMPKLATVAKILGPTGYRARVF